MTFIKSPASGGIAEVSEIGVEAYLSAGWTVVSDEEAAAAVAKHAGPSQEEIWEKAHQALLESKGLTTSQPENLAEVPSEEPNRVTRSKQSDDSSHVSEEQ